VFPLEDELLFEVREEELLELLVLAPELFEVEDLLT